MNVDNHFEKLMGPYAYGGPIISGNFKTCVDDFWVTEQLGFEPCGEGEHVYCYIEKQSVNTEQVASRLAIHASVPRKQVNYAGLKDKQGITKQWFSVHMPGKVTPDFSEINGDNIKVLLQKRHLKKLQRGVLTGNQFQVRLRNINGDISLLEQRLKVLKQGFPNYFGAQRFGYQGQNLEKAKGLFFENKKIKNKALKGLILSAARSWLFNRQLALRIIDNSWNKLVEGDLINICGSNSVFCENIITDELRQRVQRSELAPSGLLWGICTTPNFESRFHTIKQQLLNEQAWLDALESRGVEMMVRPLVCIPEQLSSEYIDQDLVLTFFLRKGSYATSLLRELCLY